MADPAPGRPTILVVDDDASIRDLLVDVLQARHYRVLTAGTASACLEILGVQALRLIVLDLRLPDSTGQELLPLIRERSWVPIIVCTAYCSPPNVVACLHAGADDVIGKPFDLDDLEARVEAVLRRSPPPVLPGPDAGVSFGTLTIRPRHQPTIAGVDFPVTPTQRKILLNLVEHAPEPRSRAELAMAVWQQSHAALSHTIDVYVSRLRVCLSQFPGAPSIHTVRGFGYGLVPA